MAATFDLVIVGGGNMGAALAGGLLAAGTVAPTALAIVELSPSRRTQLVELFPGVEVRGDIPDCSAAVLAVKPGDVKAAAAAAVERGARRLLSIAAGVTIGEIESSVAGVGGPVAVVRAMPNTPALVGEGASAFAGGSVATDEDLDWAEGVLGAVGLALRVGEHQLDAVTALSGSGPAYLFLVAEALVDGGVLAGLPRDLASRLTAQLLVGSAKLLSERGDAASLRAMVTSPGGTTAAGLQALEQRAVRAAFAEAVAAATRRSHELAQRD